MRIIKIYHIILLTIFFIALYCFIYERAFYDITYTDYADEFFDSGKTIPTYKLGEIATDDRSIYELYEIPLAYEILHRAFKIGFDVVFTAFIPLIIWCVVMFIIKRKVLSYKWLICNVICLFWIVYFLFDVFAFVYD